MMLRCQHLFVLIVLSRSPPFPGFMTPLQTAGACHRSTLNPLMHLYFGKNTHDASIIPRDENGSSFTHSAARRRLKEFFLQGSFKTNLSERTNALPWPVPA
jgi:hypothetical protein